MNEEKLEAEIVNINDASTNANVNKPTDEEIEQFKQNFENAVEQFQNTKYQIGDKTNGAKYLSLIVEYLEFYAFWSKELWKGFIKLDEELNTLKESNDSIIILTYQALEFTNHILTNPSGFGLQSAKNIEKRSEDFAELFTVIHEQSENANKTLKEIQHKQDIYFSAIQGFYLETLEDNLPIDSSTGECRACEDDCKCKDKNTIK